MECDRRPWKVMELLEYSMGFLCAMIYNKLTCTSKGERPPPNLLVLVATRTDLSPERPISCRRELSPPLSLRRSFALVCHSMGHFKGVTDL